MVNESTPDSLQCEPGDICAFRGIGITLFSSCSTAFDLCKTPLIHSNTKENDFHHILIYAEQSLIQLFSAVP